MTDPVVPTKKGNVLYWVSDIDPNALAQADRGQLSEARTKAQAHLAGIMSHVDYDHDVSELVAVLLDNPALLSALCGEGVAPDSETAEAIAIIEGSRQTHVEWLDYLAKHGDDLRPHEEIAGDADHHREAIEKYDRVLAVLRRPPAPDSERPDTPDAVKYEAEKVMDPILRRWFGYDCQSYEVEHHAENAAVDLSWALADAGLLAVPRPDRLSEDQRSLVEFVRRCAESDGTRRPVELQPFMCERVVAILDRLAPPPSPGQGES
jgi:hypothetical protein